MVSHSPVSEYAPGMRTWGVLVAVAIAAAWCAPAAADGPRVIAGIDNTFTPRTVTIVPGTTVNWENRGTTHNVKFEDGAFEQPAEPMATPWFVYRTFDAEGEYRYFCESHGGPGGAGMSGVVVVSARAAPVLTRLTVRPSKVCNSKRCRKRGGTIRFTLSEDARVAGGLDPIGKPAERDGDDVEFQGRRGSNKFALPLGKLVPGRYRLTLTAEDDDGNESDPATAKFGVYRPAKR